MMHSFSELVIGDILIAPFIGYAAAAFVIFLIIRPILYRLRFRKLFSHPAIAELGLYVTIIGLLTIAF
jgi:hypothetical protein